MKFFDKTGLAHERHIGAMGTNVLAKLMELKEKITNRKKDDRPALDAQIIPADEDEFADGD